MKQFAIIGCGRIARRHAANITRIGKLVAVCDTDQEKAAAFAADYNAIVYYSVDDLLKAEDGIDIVAICTPNGYHAEHIIKSLQARKHVLCEKPLCLTKAAAWQIIETEKFCRRKLYVVKSVRYNSLMQQLKALIDEGALGKIYSFHLSCIWNRSNDYYKGWRGKLFPDGGTLYNQFSHYIDGLLWLFGSIAEVKGFSANMAHPTSMEFEDSGTVSLLMETGSLGSLNWSVNALNKNYEIALTIVAEQATIRIGGEYLDEIQYQQTAGFVLEVESEKAAVNSTSVSNHDKMYQHLNRILDGANENFPGAMEGLKTVEAIEKIYKAISSS